MKEIHKVIPFFKTKIEEVEPIETSTLWNADKPLHHSQQYFPLAFKKAKDKDWYYLPYEPMLTVEGGNTIIRRNIAKQPKKMIGTIKEKWNTRDYNITITGVLMGSILTGDVGECYPKKDFARLREYFECGESIKVLSPMLTLLNVLEIVVESFDIPFSKGENVQAYTIKAYSNMPHQLLIDIIEKQ